MSSDEVLQREQALTDAVTEERPRLLATIRRMVRDRTEAEDVLQDVLAEFVSVYDVGVNLESVGAWLARVARNKIVDRFRRKKTSDDYRFFVELSEESEAADPGNEWMREWFREEIARALESLPPEQRAVFVGHELEGRTFEEMAAESGTNVNTLLSRKRYAILALRKHLKEVYDEL